MSEPSSDDPRGSRGRRVVVVTGAAGGIGRSCALLLAQRGADLALADLDGERLAVVAAEVRALGAHALGRTVDVTDEDECAALVAATVSHLGSLDGAVLAAEPHST